MPLRADFGSFRQPVDPSRNLGQVLSGLQGEVRAYEKQKMAEQLQKDKLKQLALDNARADARLGIAESAEARAASEAERRRKQDEALGKLFRGIDAGMTTETVVPASTEKQIVNKGIIDAATKTQTEAGSRYGQLFDEELAKLHKTQPQSTVATLGDIVQSRTTTSPDEFTPEELDLYRAGYDPVTAVRDVTATAPLGELATYSPEIFKGKTTEVFPEAPGDIFMSEPTAEMIDKASAAALQKAGITDRQGQSVLPLIPEKEVKEVTIPEKIKTSELTKKEWQQRELAKAKDAGLGGAAYKQFSDVVTKQADQLFGKQKNMTLSDQLNLLKYQRGEKEKALTMKDYEAIYPSMKGKIKTPDGFKAYEKKLGKKAQSKFNIAEDLYKNMTGKDSGDVDAIYEFLAANNNKLGTMSADELKTLAAQLKAKYANEAEYLDPTDYLGGSAAGDVLSDITLQ